jgi:hypothetical protein
MLKDCRSTSDLASVVFSITGCIILRAWVGALWHDVRIIVAANKARPFTH